MPEFKPLHLKVMAVLNMPTHGPYRFGPHYQINLIKPRWYRLWFGRTPNPFKTEMFLREARVLALMRADLRERRVAK